jgi:hypothetical protein
MPRMAERCSPGGRAMVVEIDPGSFVAGTYRGKEDALAAVGLRE